MALPGAEYITGCTHTWRTLPEKSWAKFVKFTNMVKKLGQDDPRRVIHSLKVGLALALISILQYFHPSFYGFGANTIWAVFSVIFVLEFSVGATLGKGLNRMLATGLAGALGVATHRLATLSGKKGKALVNSTFVFVIAGTVTFMRFCPQVKARYDYGLIIFILTYCLVSLSDHTDSELLEMAQERLLTIIIGSCLAIMVCISICPVWIGEDLHNHVAGNLEKLAEFFEGYGDEFFNNSETAEAMDDKPFLRGYTSVLYSESSEETMAVLARWEPCHGRFRFHHPWKQYLKIGNLTRLCAYRIHALSVYLDHSEQSPYEFRSRIQELCTNISLESAKALKESSLMIKQMTKSSRLNIHVASAQNAAESLKSALRANSWEGANHLEIIPAAAVASLLIETVVFIEKICQAVDELSSLAKFVPSELLRQGTLQPISEHNIITN